MINTNDLESIIKLETNSTDELLLPDFTNTNTDQQQDNINGWEITREQVCDRCRKLKKKCYGMSKKCNNCLIANQDCMITRTLKRKRRPKPTKLNPMEIENIKLRLQVKELQDLISKFSTNNNNNNSDPKTSNSSSPPELELQLMNEIFSILNKEKKNIISYVKFFFEESNSIFPIISDKNNFLLKTQIFINIINDNDNNIAIKILFSKSNNFPIIIQLYLICLLERKYTNSHHKLYQQISLYFVWNFHSLNTSEALKCILISHIYAQQNDDQALLLVLNGLMNSFYSHLKPKLLLQDKNLEFGLRTICFCFDFFANDPLHNLSLDLNKINNMVIRFDENIINSIKKNFPLSHILYVKICILKSSMTIMAGLTDLLSLTDIYNLTTTNTKSFILSYDNTFLVLYYLDTLITLQRLLIIHWTYKNNAQLIFFKCYDKYISNFIQIWFMSLSKYKIFPLFNLSKLYQCSLFIFWYNICHNCPIFRLNDESDTQLNDSSTTTSNCTSSTSTSNSSTPSTNDQINLPENSNSKNIPSKVYDLLQKVISIMKLRASSDKNVNIYITILNSLLNLDNNNIKKHQNQNFTSFIHFFTNEEYLNEVFVKNKNGSLDDDYFILIRGISDNFFKNGKNLYDSSDIPIPPNFNIPKNFNFTTSNDTNMNTTQNENNNQDNLSTILNSNTTDTPSPQSQSQSQSSNTNNDVNFSNLLNNFEYTNNIFPFVQNNDNNNKNNST